ncbi:MAG: tRNA (adenosine(37)-N6)-dimethylallyltransferase MiaA [bacterium]|nr:tRNA (adenosine(37)-N6)-dimethylallyltransferase MiaA [bacterium]
MVAQKVKTNQESNLSPLLVVVGPTASGKSQLAMEIARKFNGEIICADSRTVYKGMDIGTAKPSTQDQQEVNHHIIDIVKPDEVFTAASFKRLALQAITDITNRGKLPILVGGTGLYIDGVIFDFAFLPPVETEERARLQQLSVAQLQQRLIKQNIAMPENKNNPRHLIRAIETNGAVPVKGNLRGNTLVLGIEKSKQELTQIIENRTKEMIKNGLKQEVKTLAILYGWDSPGLSAVGYREWHEKNDEKAIEQSIIKNSLNYAKRQRTWFRRNPHIAWIKNSAEVTELVQSFIQQNKT